jgi:DNA polymerase-4
MHLDMDAFYAAVEQSDHPELKGKPVIVGGSMRGVVCAASYEARRYGVHSAMAVFQAARLCPHGIFLPVRMERYKQVSCAVMEILRGISPLVEQVSIDEAYVDIAGTERLQGPPYDLANRVKAAIRDATSLTCSVGIAPNKLVAKIASDFQKPDGLTILVEDQVKEFLARLPIGKIPGVGSKTGEELRKLGIVLVSDLLRFPSRFWAARFGKWGAALYEKARGIDNSAVEPYSDPKSISAERTFPEDTGNIVALEKMLLSQAEEVGREIRRRGFKAKTVTLKVKFFDFKTITRSRTVCEPFDTTETLFEAGRKLLAELKLVRKVRLIGIGVANFSAGPTQLSIGLSEQTGKQERLDRALDLIHSRFQGTKLVRGRMLLED